ncbi:hypothetical protein BGX26_006402 [Mortierella sp. AD094]|nr:hypothetical protein BGX26_006402 [Mortierella sp. AD094]
MTQKPTNPLDVTWIRIRISQYVTPKDALACVLVSKDWSEDFIPSIWHTVDFDVHRKFTGLTTEAISKHGHHIRVMKNLKSNDQTAAVQNSSIYKLVSLSMTLNLTLHFQACCYDILRRNIARLEHVSISKQSPSELYLFVDALSPSASDNASSRLSSLKLDGISMTQDAFSSLLRMSPALVKLEMRDTKLSVVSSTEPYQHPNTKYLAIVHY